MSDSSLVWKDQHESDWKYFASFPMDDVIFTSQGKTIMERRAPRWSPETADQLAGFCNWFDVSNNGKWVASSEHFPGRIYLYDRESGRRIRMLTDRRTDNCAVAFSPESKHVIGTELIDSIVNVTIWEAESGHVVRRITCHSAWVHALCYTPDGQKILAGDESGRLCVWEANSGELLTSVIPHTRTILQIKFSPDGMRFVTTSKDGTAKLWRVSRTMYDQYSD